MNDLTQYYNVRPLMKTGDLLTYRTHGFISNLIHYWSPENHAGLVLDLDVYQGEIERRWTLESVSGGVHMNLLSHILERVHGKVFWHPLKPEFNDKRADLMIFSLDQVGCVRYDTKGLLKQIFGRVSADLEKLFCSEYVFLSWKEAKMVTGEVAPYPSELAGLGVTLPPVCIVDSGDKDPNEIIKIEP
jgi:hypothetical protein